MNHDQNKFSSQAFFFSFFSLSGCPTAAANKAAAKEFKYQNSLLFRNKLHPTGKERDKGVSSEFFLKNISHSIVSKNKAIHLTAL